MWGVYHTWFANPKNHLSNSVLHIFRINFFADVLRLYHIRLCLLFYKLVLCCGNLCPRPQFRKGSGTKATLWLNVPFVSSASFVKVIFVANVKHLQFSGHLKKSLISQYIPIFSPVTSKFTELALKSHDYKSSNHSKQKHSILASLNLLDSLNIYRGENHSPYFVDNSEK